MELDYIESTGKQRVDSGIPYSDTLTFEVKFSDYTSAANAGGVFGTSGDLFSLERTAATKLYWYGTEGKVFRYNAFSQFKTYTVKCGKNHMTVNDAETDSFENSGNKGGHTITLFKTSKGCGSFKLYYFKIYDGDTIVRNYIPCIRNYDDAVGLYDLVGGRFYNSSAQGDYTSSSADITEDYAALLREEDAVSLPDLYQRVAYIESDGGRGGVDSVGQHIDTGLTYDIDNDEMEIAFQATKADQNGMILASRNASPYLWLYHYVGEKKIGLFSKNGTNGSLGTIATDTAPHTMRRSAGQTFFDGKLLHADESSYGVTAYNLYICSNGDGYFYSGRIFRVKIWKAGVLERDMVPCYRKSDYSVGMFDLVHEVFYTNSGTGAFRCGGETADLLPGNTISYLDFLKHYEITEKLTGAGEQYIDTGISPTGDGAFKITLCAKDVYATEGCALDSGEDGMRLYLKDGEWTFDFGAESATFPAVPTFKAMVALLDKTLYAGTSEDDLTPVTTFTSDLTSSRSLLLFAAHDEAGVRPSSGISVYSFSLSAGSERCEYVPTLRKDGTYGMYNVTEKAFMESQGTRFLTSREILASALPDEYYPLEYVESTGTQYIDTGIVDSSATLYEIDAQTSTLSAVIGTSTGMLLESNSSARGGLFYYLNRNAGGKGGSSKVIRTLYKQYNNRCYRNGVLVCTFSSAVKTDSQTMYLFGKNAGGQMDNGGNTKIYECTIYTGGALSRHYIPAMRKSDNEIGLYDAVTGAFYANQGEGTFLCDRTAEDSTIPVPGYRAVEYVEGTGTQYFDTGVTINKADKVVYECTMQFTTTESTWLGAHYYLQHRYADFKTTEKIRVKVAYVGTAQFVYMDDQVVARTSRSSYNYDLVKMCILAMGEYDDAMFASEHPAAARIYAAKLYKNDVLTFDYVPCLRESDGEAGLYDRVTGTFLGNAGTGKFLYGKESGCAPCEYESIDHVEYTGEQSLLLPYAVRSETKVEVTLALDLENENTFPICGVGEDLSLGVTENALLYRAFGGSALIGDLYSNTRYYLTTSFLASEALRVNDTVLMGEGVTFGGTAENVRLFGAATKLFGNVKVYRIRILEGRAVRFDLRPYIRKYDGKVGLYECVNGTFYPSLSADFLYHGATEKDSLNALYEDLDYVLFGEEQHLDLAYQGAVKYTFDTSFDPALSAGTMGYTQSETLAWSVSEGRYLLGGGTVASMGERDVIIDDYGTDTVKRYINGNLLSTLPLGEEERGIYILGKGYTETREDLKMKVYGVKAEAGAIVLADLKPVRRTSDGSIGFLDKVTNTFYAVYDNSATLLAGEIVGHRLGESRVVQEASEKQEGDVARTCAICGREFHAQTSSHAYEVKFAFGKGVKAVKVYAGYDLSSYQERAVAYTRNKYTNNFSRVDGQIYFEVLLEEGYELGSIRAEGCEVEKTENGVMILSEVSRDLSVDVFAHRAPKKL